MPNKCAIIINSPTLGGAERSILLQSQFMGDVDLIVPAGEVCEAASQFSHIRIRQYRFPSIINKASRSGRFFGILMAVIALPLLLFRYLSLGLHRYPILWANGNRAGFSCFIFSVMMRFKGKLVWHFRDYPITFGKWKYIWKVLSLPRLFRLVLVGNSQSVSKSLTKLGAFTVETIYNPAGEMEFIKRTGEVKTIGIVSMMAPWKGIHQVIIWASLYEKELMQMGIEKVAIFGGQIYQTAGAHSGYQFELNQLLEKFPSSLISFEGRKSPSEIFCQIDLLIHPVVEPEPFGRIISEAYCSGVPVLSTKLGGSAELVVDGEIFTYDYAGWTDKIRMLCHEREVYHSLVSRGHERIESIESNIENGIRELLNC